MKKKIILSLICCLFIFGLTTGCVKNKDSQILKTENDVVSYLESHYPDETFEILNVIEQDNIAEDACSKKVKGNKWTVYSETTGKTFEVYDTYNFNSFTCNYSASDNYK